MNVLLQIREIGVGTFGFVELAVDTTTGERVAIKFLERGVKVLLILFANRQTQSKRLRLQKYPLENQLCKKWLAYFTACKYHVVCKVL